MRVAALDIGRRRTGIAVSDPSGVLARPLATTQGEHMLRDTLDILTRLRQEDDGLATVVVGLPRHADGTDSEVTTFVKVVASRVQQALGCLVVFQDERLTSREAEALLAERERDWRKRKAKLDTAAAAVILQEFLDARSRAVSEPSAECSGGTVVTPLEP